MIYVVRTAKCVPGKGKEFTAWARKVNSYWKEHYPEVKEIEIGRSLAGENGVYAWFVKLDSLAAWERTLAKSDQDANWQKIAAERFAVMQQALVDSFFDIK